MSASASNAPGSKPKCMRMARRHAHGARIVRDHRDGAAFGEMREQRHRGGGQCAGDDQRPLRAGDPFGQRRDRARVGIDRRGLRARLDRRDRLGERRRQRLARQHHVDRPARMRHGDLDAARHHVAGLRRYAQFVIPLHQLAQHAGLVEHLLAPLDGPVARAEDAFLGDRCAPGGEQQRHAVARQVDQVVEGVGGADGGVHHHRLRLAGHEISAVRHADREVLVRHQDRLRHFGVGLLGAGEGFDDGREIGAGVAEEIIDAMVGERAQEGFGCDDRPPAWCQCHALRPVSRPLRARAPLFAVASVLRDGGRG